MTAWSAGAETLLGSREGFEASSWRTQPRFVANGVAEDPSEVERNGDEQVEAVWSRTG